ncbi:MAG: hypothetical protein Q7J68_03255 [Thermoplasmata archaeon]|nr:hypothetical protein [Thermoplasmata archaeon]
MDMIILNPKGRAVSVLAGIFWAICLVMLLVRGNWSIGPVLLIVLFSLLLALTGVRLIQEWKEDGEWLD